MVNLLFCLLEIKGKLKGNKNHFFHDAYLSALGAQIINNNKEFYKDNTCH
jgi:hypothetical protein